MTAIYHQCGHNYAWNLESLHDEHAGDGLILGPRYMAKPKVEGLPLHLRARSFFDPQFFLPRTARGSLDTYEFFPAVISDGFDSADFSEEYALKVAQLCLRFQVESNFQVCVVPTRHKTGDINEFIDAQENFSVTPSLMAWPSLGSDRPLLLQLILTEEMIKQEANRNAVLNWVTGLQPLDGVYLIPHRQTPDKQVQDVDYLVGLLEFVHFIRAARMKCMLGYLNTESLLMLAALPTGVPIGSYENLRMFRLAAFEEADRNKKRRGPRARIYSPELLQWIDHSYVGAINRAFGEGADPFRRTVHAVEMFRPSYEWYFNKPQPYKHHFSVFSKQLQDLRVLEQPDLISQLREMFAESYDRFNFLRGSGVLLDVDSSGEHLPKWSTALNEFATRHGLE